MTGVIAGLMAQGLSPFEAATLGCWLTGRAAEALAENSIGPLGLTAGEISQAARNVLSPLLKAAGSEGEGAWRMPLSPAYDAILKSHIADMRNSCGRPAGSITAAQFLKRFVKDETPWCHIDIAGVALPATEQALVGPKCASGWGVMALNRLVRDMLEG